MNIRKAVRLIILVIGISFLFSISNAEEEKFKYYRGQLHSHTSISDGQGSLEEAYSWAKEKGNADFFAVTDHSQYFDNADSANLQTHKSKKWAKTKEIAENFNEDGKFIALAGFEMTYADTQSGHINTFNTEGFYSRDSIDLEHYYDALEKEPASISQFNHPGTTFGDFNHFGYYNKERDAVINLIELGNGSGETLYKDYYRFESFYIKALDAGWHVAPVNGQDNHYKDWITSNECRTVVMAKELTREAIFEAIRQRRVYASEDSNIEVNYTLNDEAMGMILNKEQKNIKIVVEVKDPDINDTVSEIAVITNNGKTIAKKAADSENVSCKFDFKPVIANQYYFIKVSQNDDDLVFTAPVWIETK